MTKKRIKMLDEEFDEILGQVGDFVEDCKVAVTVTDPGCDAVTYDLKKLDGCRAYYINVSGQYDDLELRVEDLFFAITGNFAIANYIAYNINFSHE